MPCAETNGNTVFVTDMLFQDWEGIVRTLLVGAPAYLLLVLSLRVSGKRTLAKLNAFDLVVTVALGSTLATILLSEEVALAEGVAVIILLITLQWLVTMTSVRSRSFAKLVRSEPTLLLRDGERLPQAMRRARVTEDELSSVIRQSSTPDPSLVRAVILESDGSFSVIGESSFEQGYATDDFRRREGETTG
jgi:uncharacterized membrane protein YcaP (DUF421 family)